MGIWKLGGRTITIVIMLLTTYLTGMILQVDVRNVVCTVGVYVGCPISEKWKMNSKGTKH